MSLIRTPVIQTHQSTKHSRISHIFVDLFVYVYLGMTLALRKKTVMREYGTFTSVIPTMLQPKLEANKSGFLHRTEAKNL